MAVCSYSNLPNLVYNFYFHHTAGSLIYKEVDIHSLQYGQWFTMDLEVKVRHCLSGNFWDGGSLVVKHGHVDQEVVGSNSTHSRI